MINVFNRRLLCAYLSPEESAKVYKRLREAGISYSVKKCTSAPKESIPAVKTARGGRTGSFAFNSTTDSSVTTGIPASVSSGINDSASYFYSIYVNKNDFAAAQKVIED